MAVQHWHSDVHKDHVRLKRLGRHNCFVASVGCLSIMAGDAQNLGQSIGHVPIIVDNKNASPRMLVAGRNRITA